MFTCCLTCKVRDISAPSGNWCGNPLSGLTSEAVILLQSHQIFPIGSYSYLHILTGTPQTIIILDIIHVLGSFLIQHHTTQNIVLVRRQTIRHYMAGMGAGECYHSGSPIRILRYTITIRIPTHVYPLKRPALRTGNTVGILRTQAIRLALIGSTVIKNTIFGHSVPVFQHNRLS